MDPSRPVGLVNHPCFHVGCEEIYAEHWIVLIIVLAVDIFMLVASLLYMVTLVKTTVLWLTTQILADIDFASAMCNKKAFYIPLCIVSIREAAVIHAMCIATAVNGVSGVTVMFFFPTVSPSGSSPCSSQIYSQN